MLCIAGQGASAAMTGRNVTSVKKYVTLAKSALQSAISLGISRMEGSTAEESDNNEQHKEENENIV